MSFPSLALRRRFISVSNGYERQRVEKLMMYVKWNKDPDRPEECFEETCLEWVSYDRDDFEKNENLIFKE